MEIWKNIEGYEGYYQISNLGNIKSLSRFRKNGKKEKEGYIKKEIILKTHISKTGYYVVDLKRNGIRKTFKIHRLIALHFIDNPFNKNYINHKNGIKTDNSIENLEWCTIKENNKHAEETGLKNDSGCNSSNSKLTREDVYYIRNSNEKIKYLALRFKMNESTIYKLKRRQTYKNI